MPAFACHPDRLATRTPYLFLYDDQTPPFPWAIYRFDVETGSVEQVTTPFTAEWDVGASVSPDGAWLAYGGRILSVPIASIGFGMPNCMPDGEHLVIFDKLIMQSVRIDLRSPDHRKPVHDKLDDGITYRDGATYSTRPFEPGLWQLDGGPRLITPSYPARRAPRLTFRGDDVLAPEVGQDGDLRIMAQPLAGGEPRVAFYAPNARPDTPLAVDPLRTTSSTSPRSRWTTTSSC